MSKNWIAVASAEHVRLGRKKGFMQVCHGKAAPSTHSFPATEWSIIRATDNVPRQGQAGSRSLAIATVKDARAYEADMERGLPAIPT